MYKSLTEDLKERLTPERVAKMNERMIFMAERGNISAWEKIRDTIGEKPTDKVEVSGNVSFSDILREAREREAADMSEPEQESDDK